MGRALGGLGVVLQDNTVPTCHMVACWLCLQGGRNVLLDWANSKSLSARPMFAFT
jgi:hypothetical protein